MEVIGPDGRFQHQTQAEISEELMKSILRFEKHSQQLVAQQVRRSTQLLEGLDFYGSIEEYQHD